MKQPHSLDHDGLDGILPASRQPQPQYFYFKLFGLAAILIIMAIAAFWLQKNLQRHPLQTSARPENLTELNDKITRAEKESPNKLPAALENQTSHAGESAEAEMAASKKSPISEPVTAAIPQKDKDQYDKSLISNGFKVYFKFASSTVDLSKTEKTDLTRLAEKCNNQILITGYTCSLGSPDHNQTLGWARANTLKRLLISHGVPAERIKTASKGMHTPVASNDTLSGRALNRRAELSCAGKQ
ncbi:conserved hypothetical protein [Candidatus Methylobacter favarea]|uniref:OmpA-like domain-containing protein n=1 Tax=Candidatus Methylobacter favarea TaxID=2707345 RepID=A0A8S0WRB4_9GAMM|nr:OmpA family protein [Candidatus Methylobacter favarea]CAA9891941.1 conserved hypothetical protein [Candidatus Methylobacter favarea]